eukprot:COSAG02_NODE_43439_length_375_cov_0.351449_1_plen_65_part_10
MGEQQFERCLERCHDACLLQSSFVSSRLAFCELHRTICSHSRVSLSATIPRTLVRQSTDESRQHT